MTTPLEAASITPPAKTRWVRAMQAGAIISICFSGLFAFGLTVSGEVPSVIILAPSLVPYVLILIWSRLRGEPLRRALALAEVTGWVGMFGALLGGMTIGGDLGAALVLAAPQVVLVLGARRARAAIKRQTRDQGPSPKATAWRLLGALAFYGWFVMSLGPGQRLRTPAVRNQASAVSSLRTINTSETTYADTYKAGFSLTLAALREGPAGSQPTPSAAGLIDSVLAGGVKSGYRITYAPGPPDKAGHIKTYTVVARPLEYGKSGTMSYFTDESGVIRMTVDNRPATAKDPPAGG